MATAANTSMDSLPPLPSKHTSQRHSNLTPSPGPYDQPRPPGQPPSPLVGQAPISVCMGMNSYVAHQHISIVALLIAGAQILGPNLE